MRIKITNILSTIQNELKIKRLEAIEVVLNSNKIIEREYTKQTIEILSNIDLLKSTYKEEIELAEKDVLSIVTNDKDIKWFEIQKQYLTVDVCEYDPCVSTTLLYLKSEILVDKLETDEEYKDRILNRFAPDLLNELEYILSQISFDLDKRRLKLIYNDSQYIFDVKVQDINHFQRIFENETKERFIREIIYKDKQIFILSN